MSVRRAPDERPDERPHAHEGAGPHGGRYASIVDAVGNTPLVEIPRLCPNPNVRLYAKLEGLNPTGSVKDRIAKYMIDDLEVSGRLGPDSIILEPSSGNTGIALAMMGRRKGHRVAVVMPDNVTRERHQLLTIFGAEIIDSPGALRFCDVKRPWRTNVRFITTIELPWGINTGVTFVADPNVEVSASYSVTDADITAGIVQFVNPARRTFSGGNSTVALIAPGTKFLPVIYGVDLRLAKSVKYRGASLRLTLDLANLNNASTVLAASNTFGANWLRPANVIPGRLIKPGVAVEW